MFNTILGTKQNMTQVFDLSGKRWVGTWLQSGPVMVTQVKKVEKDGYQAVQISFGEKKKVNKPISGHLKFAKQSLKPRFLREVELIGDQIPKLGAVFTVKDLFEAGDLVKVTGVSKGKGFAGGVKRWGFSGGPKTHGQSDRHRAPGSIGSGTTPGRVLKGKKMAGRMGGNQVSIKRLAVLKIDEENNKMLVSGPVPGASGGLVRIMKAGHREAIEIF
jgi:large subunit ribosomal protein L3